MDTRFSTSRSLAAFAVAAALLAPGIAGAQATVDGEVQVGIGVRTNTATGTGKGPIGPWQAGSMEQRGGRAEERAQRLEERRERMGETLPGADMRARIDASAQARIQEFSNRAFAQILAQLDRLEAFDAKVEARITELSARGVDTARASAELAEARTIRADAEANVLKLQADFNASLTSETTRRDLLSTLKTAREELRDARRAYAEVLIALRANVRASAETR